MTVRWISTSQSEDAAALAFRDVAEESLEEGH
jgi:hypothetical protein